MSYSMDMNGWDLFNTPFSTHVKTAPQRQHADRPQQKPAAAQRNAMPAQERKTPPQPAHQPVRTQQKQSTVQNPKPDPKAAAQNPKPAPRPATPAPVATEKAASVTEQAQADTPKSEQPIPAETVNSEKTASAPVQAAPTKSPAATDTKPAVSQKELVLDMSSGSGSASAPVQDDTDKRKAHEESEAKRKAEWEAKQAAKKKAEEEAIQKLNAMSDADIIAAAARRTSTDTERLTRRNMKECLSEHIQTLCGEDPAFARKVMHPRKSIIHCFRYINRIARDYVQQELEDNDIKPDGNGYGCDVPDGLVYQWAEDYFNSTDAPEDQEKEEKFIPKPYTGAPAKTAKPSKAAKSPKKSNKTQQEKPSDSYEQMSLEGVIG